MTPKDKHTEVAWQAKQREVKTGSVEKTVHSATSAIYTASEIRSVMSHSETQEIRIIKKNRKKRQKKPKLPG